MSRRERVLVWLVLLATTLFLLAVLQDVMLPFVAGMAIDGADLVDDRGVPRDYSAGDDPISE